MSTHHHNSRIPPLPSPSNHPLSHVNSSYHTGLLSIAPPSSDSVATSQDNIRRNDENAATPPIPLKLSSRTVEDVKDSTFSHYAPLDSAAVQDLDLDLEAAREDTVARLMLERKKKLDAPQDIVRSSFFSFLFSEALALFGVLKKRGTNGLPQTDDWEKQGAAVKVTLRKMVVRLLVIGTLWVILWSTTQSDRTICRFSRSTRSY